jgi:hypothetical protein
VQVFVVVADGVGVAALGHAHCGYLYRLTADLYTVHSFDCGFSVLDMGILDEGETFAPAGELITMYVYIVDVPERFEQLLESFLFNVRKPINETSNYHLGRLPESFLCLFEWLHSPRYPHLPE